MAPTSVEDSTTVFFTSTRTLINSLGNDSQVYLAIAELAVGCVQPGRISFSSENLNLAAEKNDPYLA